MNEKISRLMDGELADDELPGVLAAMKDAGNAHAWACYHAIGEVLRGEAPGAAFACAIPPSLAARLATEPTVLAPRRTPVERVSSWAFATAATLAAVGVVGWTAYSMMDDTPAALARAGQAGQVGRAQVGPVANLPADYLVAHQEYSPAVAIQVAGPYMRAVAVQAGEPRP
jgi:sigma-E factor negative regulatory protein RseA